MPVAAREERGGRSRRRRRGRGRGGRKVYEVDGGEWLDFVSSDLKHLSPRPARIARPMESAPIRPLETVEEAAGADIIVHPSAEPSTAPRAALAEAEPPPSPEPQEAPPRYDAAALTYEPDQERREKFLSRLSRWAKKGG
jgi:hypothetical protein